MPLFRASMDRDGNYRSITSNEAFRSMKTIAFDGNAGSGATGTITLYTATGDCLASVFGVCSEDLVSAGGGTASLGLVGNTTAWIAATTATDIDSGESWVDNAPGIGEAPTATRIVPRGADIILTVGTSAITDGTITFYCLWRPLSDDGNIVAA
jgi:hypothetical protein